MRPSGCLCVFEQIFPKPREGELEDARPGLLYYTGLEQALILGSLISLTSVDLFDLR